MSPAPGTREFLGSYGPTFGPAAVDRATFARRPKPSPHWLGSLGREWCP